jgi:hypothetical protein
MSFDHHKGYHVMPEILSKEELKVFLSNFPINDTTGLIGDNPSELLDTEKEQKIYDVNVRDSSRIKFENCPQLFDLLQKSIIDKIQSQLPNYEVILRHDDLELVQYLPGQFFKAHTDYQNLTGNFFKSYTLLLSCHSCNLGGETIIYLNNSHTKKPLNTLTLNTDYIQIKETGHCPGSVLIFDKDLYHEGLPILEGRKIILVANLILIPNSTQKTQKEHYLKVNFPNKSSYLIPESWFEIDPLKKSIYTNIFKLSMESHPSVFIHEYTEELDNFESFNLMYTKMLSLCPQINDDKTKQLEKIITSLRKIQYPVQDKTTNFLKFLKGSDNTNHFTCCLSDYYEYLKLFDHKSHPDILPIVYSTVSGDTGDVVIWFGLGLNQLLTLDLYSKKAEWEIDYSKHDSRYYSAEHEYILKKAGVDDITIRDVSPLTRFHNLLYSQNGLSDEQITENREFVFQKLGGVYLGCLSLCYHSDPFMVMKDYISNMMMSIDPIKEYGDRTYRLLQPYQDFLADKSVLDATRSSCGVNEFSKSFSQFSGYTKEEFNIIKNKLDVEAFKNYIDTDIFKSEKTTSDDVEYAAGRVCNEASYFRCHLNIISGFFRINPSFYHDNASKNPSMFHFRNSTEPPTYSCSRDSSDDDDC